MGDGNWLDTVLSPEMETILLTNQCMERKRQPLLIREVQIERDAAFYSIKLVKMLVRVW